jgi:hypothetical protein
VAEEGYIYGYPLVLMDVMRRMQTAVPFPTAEGAPLNQFSHSRFLPEPHTKEAVRPHADSLRSTAWLDVSPQPIVLRIPPMDRYYLLSIFSVWGDLFETMSPRTTGMEGSCVAFVGPNWHGSLPDGIKRLAAPTETLWINGRIQAAGVEDLQIVHFKQDQFHLTPLSEWGKPPSTHPCPFPPDLDRQITPEQQVESLTAPAFYTRLSRLIPKVPPQARDAPTIRRLAQIGFSPSEDFAFETLSSSTVQAMHAAVAEAKQTIARAAEVPVMKVNNWSLPVHPRRFETDYLSRAVAARNAFWNSLAEDIVVYQTELDKAGDSLKGTHQYVIHFDQEHVPPVNAFWSITVYDSRRLLPANAIHRHVLGDRDRLRLNPDNSLSIYIQHEWPGTGKDSNWLPAPKAGFDLILQLYWPKSEVLNGIWRPPAVMRVR